MRYASGQQFHYLAGGIFGVDFCDDVCDAVVGVGDESGAHGTHVLASGHFFLLPYPEGLIDFGRFIAEEDEGQRMFLGKLDVALGRVLADADNDIAQRAQFLKTVAQ